jgi:hypothetical protein
MPRSPRFKLVVDPLLIEHIRLTKAVAGNVDPLSRFIVRLIERGLAQLDEELEDEFNSSDA